MKSIKDYINEMKASTYKLAAEKAKRRGEERWKEFHKAYIKQLEKESEEEFSKLPEDDKELNNIWKKYKSADLKVKKLCKNNNYGSWQYSEVISIGEPTVFDGPHKGSLLNIRKLPYKTFIVSINFACEFPEKVWDASYGNDDDHKILFASVRLDLEKEQNIELQDYSGDWQDLYRLSDANKKAWEQMKKEIEEISKIYNPNILLKFKK